MTPAKRQLPTPSSSKIVSRVVSGLITSSEFFLMTCALSSYDLCPNLL